LQYYHQPEKDTHKTHTQPKDNNTQLFWCIFILWCLFINFMGACLWVQLNILCFFINFVYVLCVLLTLGLIK